MPEQAWRPLFRNPRSTITKVLQSPAFVHSRERAGVLIGEPAALRELADAVDALDHASAPLSAITDRVAAAVRFLRSEADDLDAAAANPDAASAPASTATEPRSPVRPAASDAHSAASSAARERLVVAALHYLVTPVDLVPDFRAGGYLDDVVLLSWVFGAAAQELEPFVDPEHEH